MKGPATQPTALVKLKGNYRPSRYKDDLAEEGVVFLTDIPEVPKFLEEEGKEFWLSILSEAINIVGYIAVQDIFMFEELCYNYQVMVNAKKDIKKFGNTEINKNGQRTKSIGYIIYNESLKNFQSLCREFGLSPSSRTGVKLSQQTKKNQPFSDIKL